MRDFRMESYYDKEIGDMVDTYFVDDEQVCEDDYYEIMDLEIEETESQDEEDCEIAYEELPDEAKEVINMIENYAQEVENSECSCGCHLRDTLLKIFIKGVNIGKEDYKNWLVEILLKDD